MQPVDKQLLIEAHRPRWTTFFIWLGFVVALVGAEKLLLTGARTNNYWLAIPSLLLVAHLMHSQLLAFHEAAHGVLCPARWLNELAGTLLGKFHFNGLTLFRVVHQTHHAHLATEKDEQLWPFVHPETPRWKRRLAAFCELTMGLVYDIVLFWRAFFRKDSTIRDPRIRRRIYAEGALTLTFWTGGLALVARFGAWKWLLVAYVIPALICGNLHSLRKYIEHMGLTGSSVLGLTRSVISPSLLGRVFAFTMFNIGYHGVHHYYASMPEASLPQYKGLLTPQLSEERPIFRSYWEAFLDMAPSLVDPRVGPQWRLAPASADAAVAFSQRPTRA